MRTHDRFGVVLMALTLLVAAAATAAQSQAKSTIEGIRKDFDSVMKGLEGKDRMGNFEIQRLMSAFNQAETLSSNVQKKLDDTVAGQQQKIG